MKIGEKEFILDFVRLSDRKIALQASEASPGGDQATEARIRADQFTAWVGKNDTGSTIMLNGRHYLVKDKDDTQTGAAKARRSGAGQEPTAVTPPMPAIVIQVPVSEGDRVEKGDTVVVVSAMKMETSLAAPYAGIINRIGVAEGDKVMPGDILADIEKTADEETP